MKRGFLIVGAIALVALAGGCRRRNPGGTEMCTPGASLTVACSESCGIGACSGDPILRVCDGTVTEPACEAGSAYLAENDDDRTCASSGYCSRVDVTCPPSGSITIALRGFGGRAYDCAWDVRENP